jgi:signal transduction histidine kinase/CheY-like chemotaxis protein
MEQALPGIRTDADGDRRVRAIQIRWALEAHKKNLKIGIVGAAVIAGGILWGAEDLTTSLVWRALGWQAAITAALLFGIAIESRFDARARSDDEIVDDWGRRVVLIGLLSAVMWSLPAWLFIPGARAQEEAWVILSISVAFLSAAGPQSIYRPLVRNFILVAGSLFALGLLRTGDRFHLIVGCGYPVYMTCILLATRIQEGAVRRAIEVGFEKEALLQEAEAARHVAEQANRAKTAFLAAASHDMRQPLHALHQYVHHLQRQTADATLLTTIEKIQRSMGAMEDLLNAALDFSKFALGTVKPNVGTVSLRELFSRLEVQLKPLALDKGLVLMFRPTGVSVASDEILLERILQNLLVNAIRYTQTGGVCVRARQRGSSVALQVFDTGCGIAKDKKKRIFEEYYQIDNEGRDRRRGLGLGLAIVRQIAILLESEVRVTSVVGKGSVFTVVLPRATGVERDVLPHRDTEEGPDFVRGAFVVVIDDDPQALDAMATTLKDFGCRVIAATSGTDAMHQLQRAEFVPQFVVSDYRLEHGETGLRAIQMLQDHHRSVLGAEFELRGILISGDTAPVELEKVAKAGFTMLHKPVDVRRIYGTLNDELARLAERSGGLVS